MWPATIFLLSKLVSIFAAICPESGVFDSNFYKCYIYYREPEIFLAAESICRSIGGNLAEIRNSFENTFVAGIVYNSTQGSVSYPYWIGANLLMAPRWTWTTNDTIVYTNWQEDQPQDPSMFQCASVRVDSYLWTKELCSSARPFVCTTIPIADPVPTACDPGYSQYDNKCYKGGVMFPQSMLFFQIFNGFIRPMNYYDSNIFCLQNENATLPKIVSAAVQDFLYSFIFPTNSNIWLGLVCVSNSASDCYWWDNSQPISYSNFAATLPNGHFAVQMEIESGLWVYHTDFITIARTIVCEKPAQTV